MAITQVIVLLIKLAVMFNKRFDVLDSQGTNIFLLLCNVVVSSTMLIAYLLIGDGNAALINIVSLALDTFNLVSYLQNPLE